MQAETTRSSLELRDAFDLFDRDKSGAISSAELRDVLIALNFKPTEALLRKVMRQMDTDGNGSGKLHSIGVRARDISMRVMLI